MFRNLSLRSKLIALITPPLVVLGIIAIYGLALNEPGADLQADVQTLGLLAIATFILTALLGLVIGQSLADPLGKATEAARELSQVRLPAVLETLRNPGSQVPVFEPMEVNQDDEIGQLVQALNDVQASASNLASEQQSIVRAGLRDLVVNMARRNQSLLDRQIEVIDRMEASEEDPDRLEELYGLDHLATRMRRNSESLLVLAGADPARRRGGPVSIGDVLRVAMSEIEDYRHIELQNIEESKIGPQGAVDLAHLASEIMENATQFSPPESPVKVAGSLHSDGSYLISIVDCGIGMNEEQLDAANSVLRNPPELGLGLTRSLGFIVVGRLAARLGVQVELVLAPGGGTTAIIEVPASALYGYVASPQESPLLAGTSAPAPVEAESMAGALGVPEPVAPPAPEPAAHTPAAPEPVAPAPAPVAPVAEALAPAPQVAPDPITAAAPPLERRQATAAPQVPASGTSDALAKLLGLDPSAATAPMTESATAQTAQPMPNVDTPGEAPVPNPWAEQAESSSALFARSEEPAAAKAEETSWSAPIFDPSLLEISFEDQADPGVETAPLQAAEPTAKLTEAIPTGESFDDGMASLLKPPPQTTSSGLVKRDRTSSQAPVSEGRPVAASVRSPEEIRSMLARYRDGLKGRPGGAPPPSKTESSPFDNSPFGDQS